MLNQSSPFAGNESVLTVPEIAIPGQPFTNSLVIANESLSSIAETQVMLVHAPGIRLMPGTLSVDGRMLSYALARGDAETLVKIPALAAGRRATIGWTSVIDVPADSRSAFAITASAATMGASRSFAASLVADSSVTFESDRTTVSVEEGSEVEVGEQFNVLASIVNDGTMLARNAALSFYSENVIVDTLRLGDLMPGEVRSEVIPVTAAAKGAVLRPSLSYDGGEFGMTPVSINVVDGALFKPETSSIRFAGDSISTDGDSFPLVIHLFNEGLRSARSARVHLTLPEHVRVRGAGASVEFELIPSREAREKTVMLDVTAGTTFSIGAAVGDVALDSINIVADSRTSLTIETLAINNPDLGVGETANVLLEVLNEGNSVARSVSLAVDLGPGLSYESLSAFVNGNAIPDELFAGMRIHFSDVEPGAVIALGWSVRANRPTMRGGTTSIAAMAAWGESESVSATMAPFAIRPKALNAEAGALPFRIVGFESFLALGVGAAVAAIKALTSSPSGVAHEAPAPPPPVEQPVAQAVPPFMSSTMDDIIAQDADEAPKSEYVIREPENPTPEPARVTEPALAAPIPEPAVVAAAEEPPVEAPATSYPAIDFVAFKTHDRQRLIDVFRSLYTSNPLASFAHIATIAFFAPEAQAGADMMGYVSGRTRLRRIVNSAMMRLVGDTATLRVADMTSFRDDAVTFTQRIASHLELFPSAKTSKPSFAACLAAYSVVVGQQFHTENDVAEAAFGYSVKIREALAAFDGLDEATLVEYLSKPMFSASDDLARSIIAALQGLERAA